MRNATLQESVNELMMLHAMGRFTDMEQRARGFLKSFSGAPILCEFLGLALAGQHRYNDALSYFQRAARGAPDDAQFWENLASCQLQMGDLAEAERSLRRALTLEPGSVSTLSTLASVLCSLKRHDEAAIVAERALAIAPRDPAANFQRGRILAEQSELAAAERHVRLALAVGPNLAAVHNELGNVLRRQGALTEAEASFRLAIELEPTNPAGYANLGLVLGALHRRDDAIAAAHAALEALGEPGENLSVDHLRLLDILADVLDGADCSDQALNIYQVALKARPEPLRALCAVHAARRACDWEFAAAHEPLALRVADAEVAVDESAAWRLLNLAGATPAMQLATARKCAQLVLSTPLPSISRPATGARSRVRLRVGYFGGDFFDQATAHLISVIEAHDRAAFEIIAYDFSPPASEAYRSRLEAAFERMVPIRELSSREAPQRIADDEVDILIDINGWTDRSRPMVLAARPAALQVAWRGYPSSSGAPWIDYLVADPVLVPTADEHAFSEKIIRLPDSYQPGDDTRMAAAPLDRIACGLPDDAFVFCSFNRACKITPEIFEVWLQLMAAIEHSVLWLLEPQRVAADALRTRLVSRGLDPDRLVFAPMVLAPEHRARVALADLALDSFPYGSHTTASDMLWAGVPFVALMGETLASRVSASILTAAGLPELIAKSLDDYQRLALRLASDREELARLKLRVQDQRRTAALFDTARFTRNLETAFIAIWERHMSGLAPDHVTIA